MSSSSSLLNVFTVRRRFFFFAVRLYYKGQLIKTHPVVLPGKCSTNYGDYLKEKTPYATISCTYHIDKAEAIRSACKTITELLLTGDFPRARLRQAQKLLQLSERYEKDRVEKAYERTLSFDLTDVRQYR